MKLPLAVIFALALLASLVAIDTAIANVSIPHITGDFGIAVNDGIYIITFFMIGEASALALSAWITKKIGHKRLILFSILFFILTSWCCAISYNIETITISRFFQGVSGGFLIVLTQDCLADVLSKEVRELGMTIWSLIFVASWSIAPLLGGWITTNYNWRWIFYINLPISALSFFLLYFRLNIDPPGKEKKVSTDWIGILFLTIGIVCFEFFLDLGQTLDWFNSNLILFFAISAFGAFFLLFSWEAIFPHPILEFHFFKKRTFLVAVIVIVGTISVDAACLFLLPLWWQSYLGYNSFWAGMSLLPFGAAAIIFGGLHSIIAKKIGLLWTLAIGCSLGIGSCIYHASVLTSGIDVTHLWMARFLLGGGLILNYISCGHLVLEEIEPEERVNAHGIFQFIRALFGAVGTTLFMTLWRRGTILHHSQLITSVTHADNPAKNLLTTLEEKGLSHLQAVKTMNEMTDLQAATMSLNNCFYVMALVLFLTLILLPLARKKSCVAHNPVGL